MRRLLLAVPLLLIPSTAHASAAWNPSYNPAFVARAHASLTFPLLTQVCAGPGCVLSGGVTAGTYTGDFVWTGKHTFGSAADAANSVRLGETAGAIVGEGATANAEETTLAFGDATADNTLTLTATTTGVTLSASTGSVQVADDDHLICGSADFTKCARFETDGFTAGNTRAMTLPNADTTLGGLGVAQSWTAMQTFTSAGGITVNSGTFLVMSNDSRIQLGTNNGQIAPITAQTPDSPGLYTGTLANAYQVIEVADIGSDFNNGPGKTGALTQPGIIVHSQNVSTTQYTSLQAGAVSTQRRRTLTEGGGAEELFRITTATLESGGGEIDYKIHATDGTDFAVRQGKIRFVFYNNAGTVTATISGADETADGSVAIVSAGETLTYALTVNVATANVFIFLINIDSNITVNAAHADYIVTYNGPGEVVFP